MKQHRVVGYIMPSWNKKFLVAQMSVGEVISHVPGTGAESYEQARVWLGEQGAGIVIYPFGKSAS